MVTRAPSGVALKRTDLYLRIGYDLVQAELHHRLALERTHL
jgi:hypothetical protein